MPIETKPAGPLLPPFYYAKQNYGIPYHPKDRPRQEDWYTVARKFAVDVKYLIWFNFQTNNPDEVNWYLHHWVGCTKISPSGNNYMFSGFSNPGIIYIPPEEDRTITFQPDEPTCLWTPSSAKTFLMRLRMIARRARGNRADRIKKLVDVMIRVGYPDCLELWYYNLMNITAFVDWKTSGQKLREMVKETSGAFPYDGKSGLYSQAGTWEMNRGMWRIHAVKDLFDQFACYPMGIMTESERIALDASLKLALERIDDQMYQGWYQMSLVEFRTHQGGGSGYDQIVYDFLSHVTFLTKDDKHLYAAFRQ